MLFCILFVIIGVRLATRIARISNATVTSIKEKPNLSLKLNSELNLNLDLKLNLDLELELNLKLNLLKSNNILKTFFLLTIFLLTITLTHILFHIRRTITSACYT